jgi:AraC-like DNA-binding protein
MQTISQPTSAFLLEKRHSVGAMAVTHHHNTYELYYVLSGEREYFIENKFYNVCEGDLVLIPPTLLHRTQGKKSHRILAHFAGEFLKRHYSDAMLDLLLLDKPFVFRPEDAKSALYFAVDSLHSAFLNLDYRENEALFAARLYNILFIMSNEKNAYKDQKYEDERMESIIRYINENYAIIDSLDELSSHFFISKYHFSRLFKKNFSVSVSDYINTVKVRAACRLLSKSECSLTEIATLSGFNSLSYFSKVFKAETGLSPRSYRQRLKKD